MTVVLIIILVVVTFPTGYSCGVGWAINQMKDENDT